MAIRMPDTMRPRRISFRPDITSKSGGVSAWGAEQVVQSPAGRWAAEMEILIGGEEDILQYRAFVAQVQGRAGTFLVGPRDGFRPRDANGRMFSPAFTAPLENNVYLFDHTAFGQSEYVQATLAEAMDGGDTEINITLVDGDGPRPGHYFGIGERLYIARYVYPSGTDGVATVRFWPRARESATLGTQVLLGKPVCTMRFASDEMTGLMLEPAHYGVVTLSLQEAF